MANDTANVVDLVPGRRYEIYPNQPRYTQAEFQSYRLRLEMIRMSNLKVMMWKHCR